MTDDHSEFWGRGATHYRWDSDVARVVQRLSTRYPHLKANTYEDHPYPGWDGRSIDLWGPGGRGDPLTPQQARSSANFLFNLPGLPQIRHLIYDHAWWLKGAGWRTWTRDDHTGALRHTHVTYLPVPPLPW